MTNAELERLREVVGREQVWGAGLAREYAVEGRAPEAAAAPASIEELQALLRLAAEWGWAVLPWGGATQMSLGAPPERYQLALPTHRLTRVVDYQPDDMTVTVQAGVTLASLGKVLAERGQFLPLDPPVPQRATAGGTVAAAAAGPLRAAYGTPRDWLIGARVVDAAGTEVRAGGRVVKNVAGYDLCKLYTGSLGTLGVLGELTFRVLPRPPCWGYSMVGVPGAEAAEELVAAALDSDLGPVALELINAPAWQAIAGASLAPERYLLGVVFAGDEEGVAWQQAALERLAAAKGRRAYGIAPLQAEVWYRALRDLPARPGLLGRLAVPSSEVAATCDAVEALAAGWGVPAALTARAASGSIWAQLAPPRPDAVAEMVPALREAATRRGGTLVVHRLPEGAPAVDRWGPAPEGIKLMRGIKEALDPERILSPGRQVGGI